MGFGLAGLGMLAGLFIFYAGRNNYAAAAGLEVTEAGKKKVIGPLNAVQVITIGSLFLIPLCYILILRNEFLDYILLGLFIFISISMIKAGITEDKEKKCRNMER